MIAQAEAPVTCVRCARCRRALRNPQAIALGMGAVCRKKNTLALAAWVARVEEVEAPTEPTPSLVELAKAIALPARPVITYGPVSGSPEYKALLVAMAANRAETHVTHHQTSKAVPGLKLTRRGRKVTIQFSHFVFDYFVFQGQALLVDAPPFFKLAPRAQVVVDTYLTELVALVARVEVAA